MIPKKAQEILDFWFKETPAEKRFKKDEAFDKTIRDKFLNDYELASQNEYDDWQDQPMSALALVILFDQFSRNMFRDDKKACLLYTSPSPRDRTRSRMPSSA